MNKVYSYVFILVILTGMSCKKNHDSDCNCKSTISASDKYEYPVKPGSAEWNAAGQAGGIDSIYRLCQVPDSLLANMSTLGLIQSLEENPCLGDMLLRTNLFQGRDETLSKLNVSWELNKRSDAAVNISMYYNTKYPCCVEALNTESEKGEFTSNWALFDMVCTQDSVINQLSLLSKKEFASIVIDKYNMQLQYPDVFGLSKTTSILILSQLMIKAPFQPYLDGLQSDADLNYFATTTQFTSPDVLNKVLVFAQQFIKN